MGGSPSRASDSTGWAPRAQRSSPMTPSRAAPTFSRIDAYPRPLVVDQRCPTPFLRVPLAYCDGRRFTVPMRIARLIPRRRHKVVEEPGNAEPDEWCDEGPGSEPAA